MAAKGEAALGKALGMLGGSLDRLDAAVARQSAAMRGASALNQSMAAMRDDRARLANELDRALARAQELDGAAAGLSERLDRAIEGVKLALEPPALLEPVQSEAETETAGSDAAGGKA